MTLRYILRRLAWSVLTSWLILTLVFVLFHVLPGNPVNAIVGPLAGEAARQAVIQELGLNRPLWVQYAIYLGNILHGNLGTSFVQQVPVTAMLGPAFVNTLILAVLTFIVAYLLGGVLGVLAGWHKNRRGERIGTFISMFFRGAPIFWIGILSIIVFGQHIGWLPVSGISSRTPQPTGLALYFSLDFVRHLLLPVFSAALYALGLPLILMRNTVQEIRHEDFIYLARAKGLGRWRVMFLHGARNALLPLVAESSQFLGWAMGGLVTIEYVFSWPGLGYQMITALGNRDYPVGEGCFLAIALLVVVLNFLADLVATAVDPRIAFA